MIYVRNEAILFLIGIMMLSTIIYIANRIALESIFDHSKKNRKSQQHRKSKGRREKERYDWIKERRETEWRDRRKHSSRTDRTRLTAYYILSMIGCLIILFLLLA